MKSANCSNPCSLYILKEGKKAKKPFNTSNKGFDVQRTLSPNMYSTRVWTQSLATAKYITVLCQTDRNIKSVNNHKMHTLRGQQIWCESLALDFWSDPFFEAACALESPIALILQPGQSIFINTPPRIDQNIRMHAYTTLGTRHWGWQPCRKRPGRAKKNSGQVKFSFSCPRLTWFSANLRT